MSQSRQDIHGFRMGLMIVSEAYKLHINLREIIYTNCVVTYNTTIDVDTMVFSAGIHDNCKSQTQHIKSLNSHIYYYSIYSLSYLVHRLYHSENSFFILKKREMFSVLRVFDLVELSHI